MMEPTFYEDPSSRYRGGGRVDHHPSHPHVTTMKRPMTLDLNSNSIKSSKKPRLANSLLTSPDLHMLKLESPELEKLIIQQHAMAPVSQCMYPKMDERDQYSREFPDALSGMAQAQQQPPTSNFGVYHHPGLQSDINLSAVSSSGNGGCLPPPPMVDASSTYAGYHQQQQPLSAINGNNPMVSSTTNYVHHPQQQQQPVVVNSNGYYGAMEPLVTIKEEPQTVPCASPPGGLLLQQAPRSPIDMEDQEKLKLERKRLRNRIAASKCRRRKLERIARLEDKVALLKSENAELQNHVTRLKEHVCHLKQQVLDHVRSGCDILITHPSYAEEL